MSSVEEAHSLSRALAHLSRVEEKVEQVHRGQADADTFHLFDLMKDYVALLGAIREALNERNKAFQASQHAQVFNDDWQIFYCFSTPLNHFRPNNLFSFFSLFKQV